MQPKHRFLEFDEAARLFKKNISLYWKIHTAKRLAYLAHMMASGGHDKVLRAHYADGLLSGHYRKRMKFELFAQPLFFHLNVIQALAPYHDLADVCTEPLRQLEGLKEKECPALLVKYRADLPLMEFVENIRHAINGLNGPPCFKNIISQVQVYYAKSPLLQEESL